MRLQVSVPWRDIVIAPAVHRELWSRSLHHEESFTRRWTWSDGGVLIGRPRFALAFSAVVTRFSVEHSRRNAQHFAFLVAGLRKFSLAKIMTLRVTLRVSNFLSDPLKTQNAAKWRLVSVLD